MTSGRNPKMREQSADPQPPPLPPELEAALNRARGDEPGSEVDALWSRLERDIDHERGLRARIRALSTPIRRTMLALVCLVLLALVAVATPRPDLGVIPALRLIIDLAVYGGAFVALFASLLRPIHRPPTHPVLLVVVIALGVAAVVGLASLPPAHIDHPASAGGVGDEFLRKAWGCFMFGTVTALPIVLVARALMRDDAPLWALSTLLAVFAVVVGNIGLYLHCPIVAPTHLWAGHVAVLVPFAMVTAWARRKRW